MRFRYLTLHLIVGVVVCAPLMSLYASAQEAKDTASSTYLPNAPESNTGAQFSNTAINGTASIAGVVVDPSAAAVDNARVSVVDIDGRTVRDTIAVTRGEFLLEKIPSGTFHLMANATGFAPYTSESFTLTDGQAYVAATISLKIAASAMGVVVQANDSVVADAQIKAADRQRLLGYIPNFYTSFVYDAVPLNAKQKYKFALRETLDPVRLIPTTIGASIEQANNTFPGYGDDAAGYGKRWAALYGDGLFSDLLSHAVFPSLFKQDPRYFYQGTGSNKARFLHAVSFAVLVRSDSGRTVPNYSYLLGDLSAGALSNLYYPHADRGAGLVFTNTAIGIGGRALQSVLAEFIFPRLTTHKAGTGKH